MKSPSRFRPPNSASPPVLVLPPQGVPTMRLKRAARNECAEDAIRRAKGMPWWGSVRRTQPYSTAAWWMWVCNKEGT